MNHTLNERGETIIASGQEGSIVRMAAKYPDTIVKLMDAIKTHSDDNIKRVANCAKAVSEANVPAADITYLLKAAYYYVENNLEPHK